MRLLPIWCVRRGDSKSEYQSYKTPYRVNRLVDTQEMSESGISGEYSAEIRTQQEDLQPTYFSNRWCLRQSAWASPGSDEKDGGLAGGPSVDASLAPQVPNAN